MASHSYSPQPPARWSSSSFRSSGLPVDSETPPPPPPKPESHEASRRSTPLTAGPSPPSQSQEFQGAAQFLRNYPNDNQPAATSYGSEVPQALAAPPRLEDEWLPDIVKNKTYVQNLDAKT